MGTLNATLTSEGRAALQYCMEKAGGAASVGEVLSGALITLRAVNELEVGECLPLHNTDPGKGIRALRMEVLSD